MSEPKTYAEELAGLLRLAADRVERGDPYMNVHHECTHEYDPWHRSGTAMVRNLRARFHSIRFEMRVAEPPRPHARCRCGLVGDHEPTCPEVE